MIWGSSGVTSCEVFDSKRLKESERNCLTMYDSAREIRSSFNCFRKFQSGDVTQHLITLET